MLSPVTFINLKIHTFQSGITLNWICSENSLYHKQCNELEVWLSERDYSDNWVRQQILKARKRKRKDLLNNMTHKIDDYKLVFNITYHPNFSNLKDTRSFLNLLLTPDQEHQKVFHKVPIIGFRKAKNLKDILVRAKVPPVQKSEGFCGPCKKSRCEICEHILSTDSFKSTMTQRTYFTLHKKSSFPLRISPVNVTKSAVNCGFGQIYWRNP